MLFINPTKLSKPFALIPQHENLASAQGNTLIYLFAVWKKSFLFRSNYLYELHAHHTSTYVPITDTYCSTTMKPNSRTSHQQDVPL